ncbi:DinB family protein [Chitinophaga cymbidii]|uniref:DinB-like domain-containing protein n=1 Tax=Chitinophaga cymbidii TaxID=1096750 RepID=A0A512RI15_9BACT|nr:DinB family protein [Chitinophaga cymbidii]GEP95343.1 hypothetical protein CCY01nite_16030 [Chitinophaga cymbidii]
MPSFNTHALLQDLRSDVNAILNVTHTRIKDQPEAVNLQQPASGKWSAVQCLVHLNGYGRYYIPQLQAALQKGEQKQLAARPVFRSSWLGNYFTSLMKPQEDGALRSTMQAPKGYRPAPEADAQAVIAEFVQQQQQLLELLDRAEKTDIARLKVPTSLSKFIRLSTGDTLRFLIAHEQRHMLQALRALLVVTGSSATAISMQSLSGEVR